MGNYGKACRLIICIDNYDSLLQQGLEAIRQRLNILVMEPYRTSLIFILMKWCFSLRVAMLANDFSGLITPV